MTYIEYCNNSLLESFQIGNNVTTERFNDIQIWIINYLPRNSISSNSYLFILYDVSYIYLILSRAQDFEISILILPGIKHKFCNNKTGYIWKAVPPLYLLFFPFTWIFTLVYTDSKITFESICL